MGIEVDELRDLSKEHYDVTDDAEAHDLCQRAAKEQKNKSRRERLPDTRQSITHKFNVGGHEGYLIVGMYQDGRPGELFIEIAKEGSTVGGLCDTIGILTSMALQSGVPLEDLARKFCCTVFEPSGGTTNPSQPKASSLVDYIFTWMGRRFCPEFNEEYERLKELRAS